MPERFRLHPSIVALSGAGSGVVVGPAGFAVGGAVGLAVGLAATVLVSVVVAVRVQLVFTDRAVTRVAFATRSVDLADADVTVGVARSPYGGGRPSHSGVRFNDSTTRLSVAPLVWRYPEAVAAAISDAALRAGGTVDPIALNMPVGPPPDTE